MPSPARLLALPASILLLLSAALPSTAHQQEQERAWPYNLPAGAKHWPEEAAVLQRSAAVQARLRDAVAPVGVRKMSGDEGEKFFLEYWSFGDEDEGAPGLQEEPAVLRRSRRSLGGGEEGLANVTTAGGLLAPFLLHGSEQETMVEGRWGAWLTPRSVFAKRAFQCPSGTNNCSSINRPNSCCATDERCVIVEDTGLGDVGCCPSGESNCGGQVSDCDTSAGYSSCPNSDNGGCCIPHYKCDGIGCITVSSSVTTTTLPTRTVTTGAGATSSSSGTCSSGFRSCPASLGGGCCATDRACGSHTCPPISSTSSSAETPTITTTISESGSSATPVPPNRPTTVETSSSGPGASLTTFTTTLSGGGVCPTGFYACSAYYGGGCCRVGRDCASTSCPTPATQTVVVSNGVTIVAGSGSTPPPPSGATATATSTGTSTVHGGSCPGGWFSCAAGDGGGCCPNGYGCGASCTASASGAQGTVAKQAPSAGRRVEAGTGLLLGVAAVGVMGLIWV